MTETTAKKTRVKAKGTDEATPSSDSLIYIHWGDGNKGGIGKSAFTKLNYQYHLDRQIPVIGFEADTRTPDFAGIYQEIKEAGNIVRFTEDEARISDINAITNAAVRERKSVVVNLRAAVDVEFANWLEAFDVLSFLDRHNIKMIKWFVCTGEFDSIQPLISSLKQFSSITHVVVKNLKYSDWTLFNNDAELQSLIQDHQCKVIEMPKLNAALMNEILRNRLTFAQALTHQAPNYYEAEQGAVAGFLRKAYAAIESTGYTASPTPTPPP